MTRSPLMGLIPLIRLDNSIPDAIPDRIQDPRQGQQLLVESPFSTPHMSDQVNNFDRFTKIDNSPFSEKKGRQQLFKYHVESQENWKEGEDSFSR